MKALTNDILFDLLINVNKPTFVHLTTATEPRMNKTNNPYFGRVTKLTKRNYLIASEYEDRVNNNDTKEGGEASFTSQSMKGLVHLSRAVLAKLDEKDTKYVRVEFFDEIKPQTTFLVDNKEVDKEVLNNYIVKSTSNYDSQPQERKVKVLNFKFDSIKEISINGEVYQR